MHAIVVQMEIREGGNDQQHHEECFRDQGGKPDVVQFDQADEAPGHLVDLENGEQGELDHEKERECFGDKRDIARFDPQVEPEVEGKIEGEGDNQRISQKKEDETLECRGADQLVDQLLRGNEGIFIGVMRYRGHGLPFVKHIFL